MFIMNCKLRLYMYRYSLIILSFLMITELSAQKIEKVLLDKNDTTRNCYTIIYPDSLPWMGYLFLVPGFGETAEDVLLQTKLPVETAERGILTIIPTFQDGVSSFGFDSLSQQAFRRIVDDVTSRHKLQDLEYYLGGFSMGGSTVVKFAETADKKPKAVFAIDSPLDFERFYNSTKRDVMLFGKGGSGEENIYLYLLSRIEQIMGGTPQTALKNYHKISPYSLSDTTQSAIKGLLGTPIRIYIEPDIQWWLDERETDVFGLNIIDCSAMINELKRLGNDRAVLITTQNKGYRKPDNNRHPHSWSIVDNRELIEWLLQQK